MPYNILLLMTDQQRRDTLRCYGNTTVSTPAADSLAADGVLFDQAYTPTSICTPARASLLTGLHPFRHRLLANYERNVGYLEELPDDVEMYSARLRSAGYNVGLEGKWHLSPTRGPSEYGFDGPHYPGWHNPIDHPAYLSYLARSRLRRPVVTEMLRSTFPNGERGNLLAGVLDQTVTATFEYFLAERSLQLLNRYAEDFHRSGRRFFLACQWFGPHLPYLVPDAYMHRYDPNAIKLPASIAESFDDKPPVQRRYSDHWGVSSIAPDDWQRLIAAYWGYASLIDEQVGRLLTGLQHLDLWDDTVVVFTTDHGEFTGAHRLNDKGPAMYDDTYRIPLIIRHPAGRKGVIDGRFVTLTDLAPTFLELAGVQPSASLDGRSLVPLIAGTLVEGWREEVVGEFHGHHFPYAQRMIRTENYKLVVNPESVNELYDLRADPAELVNRYEDAALRDVRADLLARLYRILRARGDNFYHWMTSMYEVGPTDYDASLSRFGAISPGDAGTER